MGWAQVWRTLWRDDALRQQLVNGTHSPGHIRAYDVRTGEIVAMASLPDFDPNLRPPLPTRGDPADSPLFNRYPELNADHHLMEFVTDYLRMMVSGNLNALEIENLMDNEIETHRTLQAFRRIVEEAVSRDIQSLIAEL